MKTDFVNFVKIGEVCKIGAGNSAPQKKEFFVNGKFPFFRTSDVGMLKISRLLNTSADYLNENGTKNLKLFKRGTILMPKSGASTFLNHRVIMDVDGYVSSHLATIKTDETKINNFYLFYFLQGIRAQELIQDHKYPSLNLPIIGSIEIPLPPLPEQRRIVKILDEVFEGIAKVRENTEKNLQNAKELFESYLQSIFSNPGEVWEEKKLEDIGQITSSKRIYKNEYVKEGVPFYRIKEVKELAHNKNITIELYISKKRYTEIKDTFGVPKPGDLLMTAVGTIGEIYVVKDHNEFYFKDGNVLWFKNFDSIDIEFLKFVLMSFVEEINKLSKGSAYSALTIEKIEKHKIFLPPLPEQKKIVAKLDALSEQTKKLEGIYKQKLVDLEELKKSVLKKAFAGEL